MGVRNKTGAYVYNLSMKGLVILLTLIAFTGCSAEAVERTSIQSARDRSPTLFKTPVLVELFTSEGCSSCPPAEELLARYDRDQPFEDVELITLAFHVDYWDELGWKDEFASALFTQRQSLYARKFRTGRIYTPQMVVDGDIQFVGSREKDALKAIKKSVKQPKALIDLAIAEHKLNISISELSSDQASTVFVAFAEDGLGSDVVGGENAGKSLQHVSVVRELRAIGLISGNDRGFEASVPLPTDRDWNLENVRVIVFIQENSTRSVLGVSRVALADSVSN